MSSSTNHTVLNEHDFSALLPGLAAALEDCAAHYRDTSDAEDIHSIRVATRRVRAVLKLPSHARRPEAATLAEEAKWLAGSVSAARDADVLVGTVRSMASRRGYGFATDAKPLQQALTNTANLARGSAKRSLGSRRFNEFVQSLRGYQKALLEHVSEGEEASPDVSPFAALARDHRRLRRRAKRALASGRQEDLHRMRIAAKRVRYSVETVSNGQRDGVPAQPLAKLRKLQDLLGEAHDLRVAADRVSELAERNAGKWGRPALKTAGVLRADLLGRAGKLERRVPAQYAKVSGKRWKTSVRKLKKSV